MTMKITTHYKEALTSQMLNYKVETMVGDNKVVEGFQVSRNDNNITISPGKCIINGAIIESDENITIEIPHSLQDNSDFQVIAKYTHSAKSVNFYIYELSRNLDGNELLLSKSMTNTNKMRTLTDLSASLKSIKESLAEDQILEYENEFITSTDSVEGTTTELKIKGQTIVNVAPIKDEVDVYADLQATGNGSVQFRDTYDGIIDGINIKGKTYQNLIIPQNVRANGNASHNISVNGSSTTITTTSSGSCVAVYRTDLLNEHSTYTVAFKYNGPLDGIMITFYDGNKFTTGSNTMLSKTGYIIEKVSTAATPKGICIGWHGIRTYNATMVISDIILLKGDHTNNPDLPSYFEGIIGVGDKSKNLLNTNLINGRIGDRGQWYEGSAPSTTTEFIPVMPNKTYTISKNGVAQQSNIFLYDRNKCFIKKADNVSSTFNTANNCYFVRLYWNRTTVDLKDKVQIEEGVNVTSYEEYYHGYKTEVLSCESDSQAFKESKAGFVLDQPLMSLPNGVCDEIVGNKVIKRVGKIVFNGSEDWKVALNSDNITNRYDFEFDKFKKYDDVVNGVIPNMYCDSLPLETFSNIYKGRRAGLTHYWSDTNLQTITIGLKDSKTLTEFKQWLSNNPTTVYYELAEPIITPIDNDVVMPNGVHDKIIGDKAIRKVRKRILDGTEEWNASGSNPGTSDYVVFYHNKYEPHNFDGVTIGAEGDFLCDGIFEPKVCRQDTSLDSSSVTGEYITGHFNEDIDEIRISILKRRLDTLDAAGFRKWLSENPTTIWYELRNSYEGPADNSVILPNGVRDGYADGKVIRKIKKVILTGNEGWESITDTWGTSDSLAFKIAFPDMKKYKYDIPRGCVLSDKFISFRDYTLYNDSSILEGICSDVLNINIRIAKSRLQTQDTAGFKKWLSENPTTIWYELKEPYYDIVRNPHLKSFAPETNITGSTLVPTPFNIESYGYRKEALIEPNTQYTIHFNNKYADANFKNIKVDLGGAIGNVTANNSWLMLTITTPATLAHNELRISGYGIKVSNVMCSEGSEYREFVDGLASVGDKSKNLFNGELQKGYWYNGSLKPSEYAIANIHNIKIKPETSYTFSIEDYNGIIYIAELDSSFNEIKAYQIKTKQSITTSIGSYLRFCTANDELYKLSVNTKVQIEEGSIATTYEPYYDGHKIEILSSNKNLLNWKEEEFIPIGGSSGHGIASKDHLGVCFDCNGLTNKGYGVQINRQFTLKPNTKYTLGCEWDILRGTTSLTKPFSRVHFPNTNAYIGWRENGYVTFTTDCTGAVVLMFYIDAPSKSDIKVRFKNMFLYEGGTNSYIENNQDKTQILLQEPLRSLPNGVCDTIEKIDGQYVVVRRCGEVIVDGGGNDSDWGGFKEEPSGLGRIVTYNISNMKLDSQLVCNNLINVPWNKYPHPWGTKRNCISALNSYPHLYFYIKGINSLSEGRKWLSQNPATVVYQLATPTMHPLNYLRLPNGVADEIKDGKRIRKVGKVVLDGSEDWQVYKDDGNYITFTVLTDTVFDNAAHPISNSVTNVLSPSFKSVPNENNGRFMFNCISLNPWDSFWVRIQTNQLETPDVAGFKKWLSENPTTVWYELKTPTEEDYISPNLNLDTYNEITHIASNTLVPAIINAKIPTNVGAVIKNDIRRIEVIEDLIDKVILPSLVESHYQKTLLEFDYVVSRMLK